ncbi:MAG TPA: hypothetical protein DDX09_02080 [Hyphomonas atlantica]|nr:hypothetical protein [Hyphomonas atlantica]
MIHLLSYDPQADLFSSESSKFRYCRYQEATGHCAGAVDGTPRICEELLVFLQFSFISFLPVNTPNHPLTNEWLDRNWAYKPRCDMLSTFEANNLFQCVNHFHKTCLRGHDGVLAAVKVIR